MRWFGLDSFPIKDVLIESVVSACKQNSVLVYFSAFSISIMISSISSIVLIVKTSIACIMVVSIVSIIVVVTKMVIVIGYCIFRHVVVLVLWILHGSEHCGRFVCISCSTSLYSRSHQGTIFQNAVGSRAASGQTIVGIICSVRSGGVGATRVFVSSWCS